MRASKDDRGEAAADVFWNDFNNMNAGQLNALLGNQQFNPQMAGAPPGALTGNTQ